MAIVAFSVFFTVKSALKKDQNNQNNQNTQNRKKKEI